MIFMIAIHQALPFLHCESRFDVHAHTCAVFNHRRGDVGKIQADCRCGQASMASLVLQEKMGLSLGLHLADKQYQTINQAIRLYYKKKEIIYLSNIQFCVMLILSVEPNIKFILIDSNFCQYEIISLTFRLFFPFSFISNLNMKSYSYTQYQATSYMSIEKSYIKSLILLFESIIYGIATRMVKCYVSIQTDSKRYRVRKDDIRHIHFIKKRLLPFLPHFDALEIKESDVLTSYGGDYAKSETENLSKMDCNFD